MKHLQHYFLIQGIHGLASVLQYATRFWMVQHATRKKKIVKNRFPLLGASHSVALRSYITYFRRDFTQL